MPAQTETKILEIAREIEDYLANHPNAADSLPGVMRWWLSRQRYKDTLEYVQAALEYLESRQVITKQTNPDGTTIYRSSSPSLEKKH